MDTVDMAAEIFPGAKGEKLWTRSSGSFQVQEAILDLNGSKGLFTTDVSGFYNILQKLAGGDLQAEYAEQMTQQLRYLQTCSPQKWKKVYALFRGVGLEDFCHGIDRLAETDLVSAEEKISKIIKYQEVVHKRIREDSWESFLSILSEADKSLQDRIEDNLTDNKRLGKLYARTSELCKQFSDEIKKYQKDPAADLLKKSLQEKTDILQRAQKYLKIVIAANKEIERPYEFVEDFIYALRVSELSQKETKNLLDDLHKAGRKLIGSPEWVCIWPDKLYIGNRSGYEYIVCNRIATQLKDYFFNNAN